MAVQSFVKGDDLKKLIDDKLINRSKCQICFTAKRYPSRMY